MNRADDLHGEQSAENDSRQQEASQHPQPAKLAKPSNQTLALARICQEPAITEDQDQAHRHDEATNQNVLLHLEIALMTIHTLREIDRPRSVGLSPVLAELIEDPRLLT